jgi:hypothetical protein
VNICRRQSERSSTEDKASQTHIECVVNVEVVVAVEVAANEIVDLRLRGRVQVLELVHRLKLDDVKAVGQNTVRLALEQVLRLVRSDVRHGREHVRTVCRRALDAVAVVDPTLAGFVVHIEVLEVVVEVDRARAEVPAKECRVGREDGRDIDLAFPAERDGEAGLPLVEVRDDSGLGLACGVLIVFLRQTPLAMKLYRADVLRRGTMPRDSRTRGSRSSRGRWAGSGCRRGSRDRPSTRLSASTGCQCRRGERGARPQ